MSKEKNALPEFDSVTDPDEISKQISDAEKTLSRKYKLRLQAEQAAKDVAASYREQLKILKEDLEHEVEVISGWQARLGVLSALEDKNDVSKTAPVPKTKLVSVPAPSPATTVPAPPSVPPMPAAAAPTAAFPFPNANQPPPFSTPPVSAPAAAAGASVPFPSPRPAVA